MGSRRPAGFGDRRPARRSARDVGGAHPGSPHERRAPRARRHAGCRRARAKSWRRGRERPALRPAAECGGDAAAQPAAGATARPPWCGDRGSIPRRWSGRRRRGRLVRPDAARRVGEFLVAMGDVVGRGERAAALMGQLRSAVRVYAVESLPPGQVLERLNDLLHQLGPGDMATMVCAILDPETGRLIVVLGRSSSSHRRGAGWHCHVPRARQRTSRRRRASDDVHPDRDGVRSWVDPRRLHRRARRGPLDAARRRARPAAARGWPAARRPGGAAATTRWPQSTISAATTSRSWPCGSPRRDHVSLRVAADPKVPCNRCGRVA